jgi:hypothetical protein
MSWQFGVAGEDITSGNAKCQVIISDPTAFIISSTRWLGPELRDKVNTRVRISGVIDVTC